MIVVAVVAVAVAVTGDRRFAECFASASASEFRGALVYDGGADAGTELVNSTANLLLDRRGGRTVESAPPLLQPRNEMVIVIFPAVYSLT